MEPILIAPPGSPPLGRPHSRAGRCSSPPVPKTDPFPGGHSAFPPSGRLQEPLCPSEQKTAWSLPVYFRWEVESTEPSGALQPTNRRGRQGLSGGANLDIPIPRPNCSSFYLRKFPPNGPGVTPNYSFYGGTPSPTGSTEAPLPPDPNRKGRRRPPTPPESMYADLQDGSLHCPPNTLNL